MPIKTIKKNEKRTSPSGGNEPGRFQNLRTTLKKEETKAKIAKNNKRERKKK